MKTLTCPLNGPRNISEFVHGGEVELLVDPDTLTDAEWADKVFLKANLAGRVLEWWCHTPSAYWFIAERDTVRDEIVRTFPASEMFKSRWTP